MKVLLELLGDTARILDGVERLEDFRPDSRDRVRDLLEQLQAESERILATDESEESTAGDGGRRPFLKKALEAMSSGDYSVARGILEDAVSEFPEDFEFLNYLGLVCWEQGDLEDAESAYHRAVQIVFGQQLDAECVEGPGDAALRAVEGRALALYRLGELDRALECFEWLGEHFSEEYVGCRYLAGEILHLQGDVEAAIDRYERVPVEPAVLYNLGLAHFQNHALDEAVRTWIQGFVANIHVAAKLLDRGDTPEGCTPGHLGSEAYAEDFLDACLRLWHRAAGSIRFLERCFDHPDVQDHIEQCRERGQAGSGLLQAGKGAMECAGWLDQLQDEATLASVSDRVVDRLRV